MKPTQLDDSLLTAYLDGELSEQERELVEEQLKVNERWKQLLVELQSVQNLIRELPTPILQRSITDGPWSQVTRPDATASSTVTNSTHTKTNSTHTNQRSVPMSILAIAASLLVCALGSFAWLRYAKDNTQIANMEQSDKKDDRTTSAPEATPAEHPAMSDSTIATKSSVSLEALNADQPLQPAEQMRELATMPVPSERGMSASTQETQKPLLKKSLTMPTTEGTQSERSITSVSSPADPIETLVAVRAKSRENSTTAARGGSAMLGGGMSSGQMAKDRETRGQSAATNENVELLTKSAGASSPLGLQDERIQNEDYLALQGLAKNQLRELRIMRSDLPLVTQQLRELGWVIQVEASLTIQETRFRGAMRQLSELESTRLEEIATRPPTLTGAIDEPSDWIRIIFEEK